MQDISLKVLLCAGHISKRRFGYVQDLSVRVRLCAGHISEVSVVCGTYQ